LIQSVYDSIHLSSVSLAVIPLEKACSEFSGSNGKVEERKIFFYFAIKKHAK